MSAERKHRIPFLMQPRVGKETAKWVVPWIIPVAVGYTLVDFVQQDSNAVTPNYTGISRMSDRPELSLPGTLRAPDAPVRPADQPLPQEPIIQERVAQPILRAILNPSSDVRTNIDDDGNLPGRSVISITRETATHSTTISTSILGTAEEIRNHTREIDWTTAINIQARYEKLSPFGNTLLAAVDCTTNSLNSRNFQEVSGEYSGNQFRTENQRLYRQTGQLSPDQRNYQLDQANLAAETTRFILSKLYQPR